MLPMDTTWYPVMTVEHFNTTSDQSVDGGQLTLRQGGRIIDWSFFAVLPIDTIIIIQDTYCCELIHVAQGYMLQYRDTL